MHIKYQSNIMIYNDASTFVNAFQRKSTAPNLGGANTTDQSGHAASAAWGYCGTFVALGDLLFGVTDDRSMITAARRCTTNCGFAVSAFRQPWISTYAV